MSSYVYPGLTTTPGLTLDVIRSYKWKTGYQEALSGKQSTLAYRSHPLVHFELKYELLRDFTTPPSEIKTVVGLHNAMLGRYDTFLYTDGELSSTTAQAFGTGNGATTAFQLVAVYAPASGAYAGIGASEIIQNLNGTPTVSINRYGNLELYSTGARTNLILQSSAFDNASWTAHSATVTANTTVAPDGTTTADTISDGVANAAHYLTQSFAITSAATYTHSVWLKNGSRQYAQVGSYDGSGNNFVATFDLVNGVITQQGAAGSGVVAGATILFFPSGWFRCSVTGNLGAGITSTSLGVALSNTATPGTTVPTYTGTNATIIAWGAQAEAGSNETAYIPTTTTSQSNGGSDYSISATAVVTFTTAPINAALVAWSGSFYYRCRFDDDSIDWTKFMDHRWSVKKVSFTSVLL